MNKHILMVQGWLLHPENYTKERLEGNYHAAARADVNDFAADIVTAAVSVTYVVTAAVSAAYWAFTAAVRADNSNYTDWTADYVAKIEYWLNRYFELTGENKQDYIDAINKGNKQ